MKRKYKLIIDKIVENILNNLVLAKFINKQNTEVNGNNMRYFEKEEKTVVKTNFKYIL